MAALRAGAFPKARFVSENAGETMKERAGGRNPMNQEIGRGRAGNDG